MGGAIGDNFTHVYMGPDFVEESTSRRRSRIGNMTPFAEFNIWCDPAAAKSIFSNSELASKTSLITLDLTHQVCATEQERKLLLYGRDKRDPPTRLRRMFYELLVFFAKTYADVFGLTDGPPLHDPVAVAILLDQLSEASDSLFDDSHHERWQVEVEIDGEQAGRTKIVPGTALALALHEENIPCQIFESRSKEAEDNQSGVVLTPNGLQVLDALGVFSRITDRSWKSEFRTYKNDKDETTRKTLIANEQLYGYKNHRLWRKILLTEMKLMLEERNINIKYNSRFDGVSQESDTSVSFRINGEIKHTSMLVGADGIFSTVRKYIDAETRPQYTGIVGNLAHIRRDTVKWPYSDYEPACTIQGKPGAFFIMPEDPQAKEIMVGMQVRLPENSRAEWDALAVDKDKLCDFFRKGYDDWHDTAKQIIDQVCKAKESIYLWPFLKMPKLERWHSNTGCVVILGDAAHAIPPSSGQGVNQALEDVYCLVLMLKKSKSLLTALTAWQKMRQTRIDAIFDWATNATNVQRLPEAERNSLIREGKIKDPKVSESFDDMRWLYQSNLELEVSSAINSG
ncbi:hypothetical protein LTR05_003047 [Lithohypha guttulata]|uniref:FAD-binding domain-containing protein n=1 Tax=Lithohypha guttulata TaxID=1690604 RepID=A0AAN7Y8M1_9EURO|nr:hypothetical protein LTR05_003047 [Lithohypha guttulata]